MVSTQECYVVILTLARECFVLSLYDSKGPCGHLVTEVLQHCSGELLKLSLVLRQALQLLWQAGGQLGGTIGNMWR